MLFVLLCHGMKGATSRPLSTQHGMHFMLVQYSSNIHFSVPNLTYLFVVGAFRLVEPARGEAKKIGSLGTNSPKDYDNCVGSHERMNKPMFSETVCTLPRISSSMCGIVRCVRFTECHQVQESRWNNYHADFFASRQNFHDVQKFGYLPLSFPSRCWSIIGTNTFLVQGFWSICFIRSLCIVVGSQRTDSSTSSM